MAEFIGTLVFVSPGIMAYFFLHFFGITPATKHTPVEISGISAILWLPVSFTTLLALNFLSKFTSGMWSIDRVWTLEDLNKATSDLRYLALFLVMSLIVGFLLCWLASKYLYIWIHKAINKVRDTRGLARLSSNATVWEEFFIKIEEGDENEEDDEKGKEALLKIYKFGDADNFIAGSMSKASRPFEPDKSLVLQDTEVWTDVAKNEYLYPVKKVYIDIKSGMVVEELDHKNPLDKTIPKDE